MAGNIPPFAQSGFSFDPNLSPNNGNFAAAVRAVMTLGGYPVPGPGATSTGTSLPATVFANPTNKVSGTATNGTSTFAMRADAAPAVDQGFNYAWTGTHNFNGPAGGNNVTLTQNGTGTILQVNGTGGPVWLVLGNGNAGAHPFAINPQRSGVSNAGFEIVDLFGGTATPMMQLNTATNAATIFTVYGPTIKGLVDMTPDAGSFGGTWTGIVGSPVSTIIWSRIGNLVTVYITSTAGSSNSVSCSIGQLPAEITPTRNHFIAVPGEFFENNSAATDGIFVSPETNNSIVFGSARNSSGFTAAGQKGLLTAITFSYHLG